MHGVGQRSAARQYDPDRRHFFVDAFKQLECGVQLGQDSSAGLELRQLFTGVQDEDDPVRQRADERAEALYRLAHCRRRYALIHPCVSVLAPPLLVSEEHAGIFVQRPSSGSAWPRAPQGCRAAVVRAGQRELGVEMVEVNAGDDPACRGGQLSGDVP